MTDSEHAEPCWWLEDDCGTWDTACGHSFEFTADGPHENTFKFCCFCGNPLMPSYYSEGAANE